MKPTWETSDGAVKLYLGDHLDVLSDWSGGTVDCWITSPMYNLGNTTGGGFPVGHYDPAGGYASRGGGGKWRKAGQAGGIGEGYDGDDDNMPHDDYVKLQKLILTRMWMCLSSDGAIYYNHKPRVLGGRLVTPMAYLPDGLTQQVRQVVIWARAGGINFSPSFYLPTHEWIVILAKDAFRLKSKGASGVGDVWRINQEENPDHPAPFPIELPLKIIETTERETYGDCHLGSGTTGVACIRTGRKFIGIEKSPKYFDIAVRRIEAELNRAPLFDAPPKIVQRNLLESV